MRVEGDAGSRSYARTPLGPGTIQTFRLLSAEDGVATVRLASGTVVRARIQGEVKVGFTYSARVVRRGSGITLRVLSNSVNTQRPSLVRELGLPDTGAARAVVRAFIASGASLDDASLRRAIRRVERERSGLTISERARIAALLEDRGVTDDVSWETVTSLLGDGSRSPGDERQHGEDDGADRDGGDLEDAVRKSIRFSNGESPLQLFNHVRGAGDHWIIIPFSVQSHSIGGSIRLKTNPDAGFTLHRRVDFSAAIVDVRDGDNRFVLAFEKRDVLRLVYTSGAFPEAALQELIRRLSLLGVATRLEDGEPNGPNASDEFDGFSTVSDVDILIRTDRKV